MRALNHFIVNVPEKSHNTIELNGEKLFLDTRFDEFEHRVSHGTVVCPPSLIDTGVSKGDTLFFHHHVTQNEALDLGEDNYLVVYDPETGHNSHAIAFRDSDGKLGMLSDWLFVQPIETTIEDVVTSSGIILEVGSKKVDTKEATVFIPHPELESQGVVPGDTVGFSRDSDYKMKLDDGSVVYRMRVSDLDYVKKG